MPTPTTAPNHQKLIIPGKNAHGGHTGYPSDMRAIEQWANEGIVRKLIAGSGITLNPASGVDNGNGIEVSASGGAGLNYGTLTVLAGPEDYGIQTPLGGFYMANNQMDGNGTCLVPMVSKATPALAPSQVQAQITTSWVSYVGPGQSACLLPVLIAPTFTGATSIEVALYLNAVAVTSTTDLLAAKEQQYSANTTGPLNIQLTSGMTYQTLTTDFPAHLWGTGGDLTFTPGSGPTGNGWVSTSGDYYYFGSVVGFVNYDTAVFSGPF